MGRRPYPNPKRKRGANYLLPFRAQNHSYPFKQRYCIAPSLIASVICSHLHMELYVGQGLQGPELVGRSRPRDHLGSHAAEVGC